MYTIIADYDGGTYVDQVQAKSINDVIPLWFNVCELEILGKPLHSYWSSQVNEQLIDDPPTLLKDCINVWYQLVGIEDNYIHLNIIKTVST